MNRINIMIHQPKPDLYDRVINKINLEEKMLVLRKRLILGIGGLIMSFSAFIPMLFKLVSDASKSGLTQFLSLLISDFNLIMNNIFDYALTILESTPAFSLALALTAMLAIIFCLAKLADTYADFKKLKEA